MVNVWTYSGRVGADAEIRSTQSGEQVVSFRVANDVGFGERRTTQWVENSYWGKRAAAVAPYIKKGDKITVSGELQLKDFDRKDGTPGQKLSVRVNDLDLASRTDGDATRSQGASSGSRSRPSGYDGDRPLPPSGNRDGGNRGGGGGNDYGATGGSAKRGGGKPAFDQDLDDEIPFISC